MFATIPKEDYKELLGKMLNYFVDKEDYFLEIKASYTIEELTDYYIKQMKLNITGDVEKERNRLRGSLTYLMEKFHIDLMLFLIDSAANHIEELDLKQLASDESVCLACEG